MHIFAFVMLGFAGVAFVLVGPILLGSASLTAATRGRKVAAALFLSGAVLLMAVAVSIAITLAGGIKGVTS